ncbi:RAB4B protein, partial [Corythaixoides concolor]|nr:RAB4B protein [Corythaixoides concolor]
VSFPLLSPSPDFLFKFLVIGSAGTGKSCLLHQFIENKCESFPFLPFFTPKPPKFPRLTSLQNPTELWILHHPTPSPSSSSSSSSSSSCSSRETYNALTNWLTDARTLASPNIVIILCGNKKDLDADREVTFLEASRFAQENELMFLETSALTGENVEEAFLKCARTILNKIESGTEAPDRDGFGVGEG